MASIFEGLAHGKALGLEADSTATVRSENGVGALVPWAGGLYALTYNSAGAANDTGSGVYLIDKRRNVTLVRKNNQCHFGRMVHKDSNQLFIGPIAVKLDGTWAAITGLGSAQISAYARHISTPTTKVYALSMGGSLFEIDTTTLAATLLMDVKDASNLNSPGTNSVYHCKAMWKGGGNKLYVGIQNPDGSGRLGRWNGTTWEVLDSGTATWAGDTTGSTSVAGTAGWINCSGSYDVAQVTYCTGFDDKSVLLWVYGISGTAVAQKYRLPYGSEMFKYYWCGEVMRTRAVESERYLMDAFGVFYEISPFLTGKQASVSTNFANGEVPRVRALCNHSRVTPDFCTFDGHLVLGGNHQSEIQGAYVDAGQSSGGLYFTSLDEMVTSFPKAGGVGWLWKNESVLSGVETDPMIARGFDRKSLIVTNDTATPVTVDILAGLEKQKYTMQSALSVPANGMAHYEFPNGFDCDRISVKLNANCTAISARVAFT